MWYKVGTYENRRSSDRPPLISALFHDRVNSGNQIFAAAVFSTPATDSDFRMIGCGDGHRTLTGSENLPVVERSTLTQLEHALNVQAANSSRKYAVSLHKEG